MSGLIKSGAAFAVRGFADLSRPVDVPAPQPDPAATERDELRSEIRRLQRALIDANKATDAAHEVGHSEGLAQARRDERAVLAALRDGIASANTAFEARLAVLDGLAPALAGAALARLFGSVEDWRTISEAMLTRQLAELRRSSVVAVRVSPADFPDAGAVQALATEIDAGRIEITIDGQLRAGACRIECKLGQIDLDARQQWQTIAVLLAELADGSAG